jgi:GDP-4-dehydro-6-deoxy-D-mannose reductase
MSANRLLVTGANGFIGRWMIDYWRQAHPEDYLIAISGPEMQKIDNVHEAHEMDLLNDEAISALIQKSRPTHVIHLAGQISRAPFKAYIDTNVIGTRNLFDALSKLNELQQVRVLQASTAAVYGDVKTKHLPIKETQNKNPLTPYGFSKLIQEKIGEFMWRTNKLPVVTACIFNTVGPGQAPYLVPMTFIRQLADIHRGHLKIIRTGDLTAKRDFIDIRDIVTALEVLLKKGLPGNVYNVGTGESISIEEVLQILMRLSNCKVQVKSTQKQTNHQDVSIFSADISKIKKDTGWQPRISISEALKYAWHASLLDNE